MKYIISYYFTYRKTRGILKEDNTCTVEMEKGEWLGMEKHKGLYRKLFLSTFTLSAFTFGGGYVIVPLMRKKFVEEYHWIDEMEMINLVAIAQSSPGAVAVNASLIIGFRLAGVLGALVAVLGTVLPPLLILTAISFCYDAFRSNQVVSAVLRGMQAGVAAVIADVVISMGASVVKEKDPVSIIIMPAAFVCSYFLEVNVVYIILICGAVGALRIFFARKGMQRK